MLIALSTYIAFSFLKVQCKHKIINKYFVLEMQMCKVNNLFKQREYRHVIPTYAQLHHFKVKYCKVAFMVSFIPVLGQ